MESQNLPTDSSNVSATNTSMTSASATVHEVAVVEHSPDMGSLLFKLEPGMAIWTWVVFLIVLVILWRFAWRPILKVLDDRTELIKSSLDNAEKARRDLEDMTENRKKMIAETEKASAEILQKAKVEAQQAADDIRTQARTEAKRILDAASQDLAKEKAAVIREIREETVQLALMAASKVISEKVDEASGRKIVERELDLFAKG
jgi:F-type H+-transporting ATPase subunit b